MEIVEQRKPVKVISYYREFSRKDDPGAGFAFPCDEKGDVLFDSDSAKENFEYAKSHPELLSDDGIKERSYSYMEPAKGKCSCGQIVTLEDEYMGACKCPKCGQWYNLFGQKLLNPEYWEDEFYEPVEEPW